MKTGNATYKLTTKILSAMNNKLLVGRTFYDLEKEFDCVDLGIQLCKLKFYVINGKDLALYQSYLDNRYFRRAIYNDSDNSSKVSGWAKVRHGVPEGSVLGLLLFLLCMTYPRIKIQHLPKNKNSAPIVCADDTSILFAHSNLIDFNKHIHIVFVTLNKWFKANHLLQNFNKINYVHFTTKRNMSVNLKIGFYNDLITNSFYTKFVGMAIDNTLSWNNHIDLLMKKLSTACYIIRNAKTYTSALSLKIIYHTFFHLGMIYKIIFWGKLVVSCTIFNMQKKAIRIMEGCGIRVSCRNLFKKLQILPLTSQYLICLLMFVVQNKNILSTNVKNHNIDMRQRNNLYLPQANLTICKKELIIQG